MLCCSPNHTADIGRDADHLETLARTFCRGLPTAAKDAQGDVMFPRCCLNAFQGVHEFGFGSLGAWREAKLSMEIVWPHERHIYARHGENTFEMFERPGTLDLNGHDNFIIRHPRIIRPIGDAEPVGTERAADTARTKRRIFCVFHNSLRLFAGIDHRDYYTPCSGVQSPLVPLDAIPRNTHDGCAGTGISDSGNHIGHEHRVMRGVFHVHHEPIEAEPGHDPCRGYAGEAQPCSKHWLTSLEFFFYLVCAHRNSSFWWYYYY